MSHNAYDVFSVVLFWTGQALLDARAKLTRAQHDSQETFQAYTASLESERQARQEVHAAEQRRDDLSE